MTMLNLFKLPKRKKEEKKEEKKVEKKEEKKNHQVMGQL